MHRCFLYNEQMMCAPKVKSIEAVTLYGRGVFTTLAIYNQRPFLWREHWTRLLDHAARIGVETNQLKENEVKAQLARLIETNQVEDGRARLTLVARSEPGIWQIQAPDGQQTDLIIITGDAHPVSDDGLALTVSPHRLSTLSPLAGIKSLNYLEHILPLEEARVRDFDEAVMLNERGEVVGATVANIFWATNGTLHTPALSTGALNGTTRACVLDLSARLSIPLVEGVYDLSDLGDADEIFLTSAGQGVAFVTTFDFHRYTVPAGSVALRLREAFRQLTINSDK